MSQGSHVFSGSDAVLAIPRLRVDDVHIGTGPFVAGPPSPVALCGFAHKLQLDARGAGFEDLEVDGIAILVHEFSVMPGHPRVPPERRGEHDDQAGSMLDVPRGRLLCSLLFAFTGCSERASDIERWMSSRLRTMRLSGGHCVSSGLVGRSGVRETVKQAVVCPDVASLDGLLRALPPGSFLADRAHLLADRGEQDALDAVLDAVRWVQVHDAARPQEIEASSGSGKPTEEPKPRTPKAWRRTGAPWVVPIDVGYRALSSVARRPGMRNAEGVTGHAWVEGVVSLGQWVPKPRGAATGLKDCLWRYGAPSPGLYLVTALD